MDPTTLNAEAIYQEFVPKLSAILSTYAQAPHLVGIASGGQWLVERLQQDLHLKTSTGVLSSSMHRDDFSQRGLSSSAPSFLPFDVNGANLIVLDDVLYTGRTMRAVLNELFDYGRPASVKLAVLVDRGGRELPIQPDLSVVRTTMPPSQSLQLVRAPHGLFGFEIQDNPPQS